MQFLRAWVVLLFTAAPFLAAEDAWRIDAPHPRLFLSARRLKLLRRERERQSMRWSQFQLLMAGKAPMPEPGFAEALYYQVSGNAESGRRAVKWALGPAADLRQLALVFDWCQDLVSAAESEAMSAKLARGIQQSRRDPSVAGVRSRLLAALALSGHLPEVSDRELDAIRQWWHGQVSPALNAGRNVLPLDQGYPLAEILHAVRDNADDDLREEAPAFFRDLPMVRLLSYYPAPYSAAENEFRIPAVAAPTAEPDLRHAALARAADLALVALDANAPGSQILQGWLMDDNFLLRGAYGIPYEFLWANPYQPGLSYFHAPLALHDTMRGRLFVRSSWEDSASWLGYFDGQLQVFETGRVKMINPRQDAQPLPFSTAVILFGAHQERFKVTLRAHEPAFVVGLQPRRRYLVEVDDEEMTELETDSGGILELDLPPTAETGVRWKLAAP